MVRLTANHLHLALHPSSLTLEEELCEEAEEEEEEEEKFATELEARTRLFSRNEDDTIYFKEDAHLSSGQETKEQSSGGIDTDAVAAALNELTTVSEEVAPRATINDDDCDSVEAIESPHMPQVPPTTPIVECELPLISGKDLIAESAQEEANEVAGQRVASNEVITVSVAVKLSTSQNPLVVDPTEESIGERQELVLSTDGVADAVTDDDIHSEDDDVEVVAENISHKEEEEILRPSLRQRRITPAIVLTRVESESDSDNGKKKEGKLSQNVS